ncbi:MAG: hypothetical protein LH632_15505 [Rhodoferax sp.]|nr:hypothetical protein [Rhodoferax sp.]
MAQLMFAPGKLAKLGELSRVWMKKNHGKRSSVNLQLERFQRLAAEHLLAAEKSDLTEVGTHE